MSKIENIINALQEYADGDNIIAYGFVCDTTEQPVHVKGFVIGTTTILAACLAHIMEDETFHKVITRSTVMRLKNKRFNLAEEKNDEKGHFSLN